MRCNRCGANLKDDAKFCNLCGGSVLGSSSNKSNKPKPSNGGFTDIFVPPANSAFNTNYKAENDNINLSQNNNSNIYETNVSTNNVNVDRLNTDVNNVQNNTGNYSNMNHDNSGFKDVFAGQNNSNSSFTNNFNSSTNQNYDNNMNQGFNNYNMGQNPNNMNFNIGSNQGFNNSNGAGKKTINFKILVPVMLVCLVVGLYFVTGGFAFLSGKRTIMIYMIGSDLEAEYAAASLDINEISNSGADFSKNNILIYTGGSKKWQHENVPSDKNVIFKVNKDGTLEKLKEFEKVSMVDSNTLASFLEYGYTNYKASKYSLILWDHGGGPVYGYGIDQNFVGSLTIPKLKQAFDNSPFKNKKLEMIGFDACLMSSVEIASVMSNYANYMIASQEVEPGYGWDYRFLSEVNSNTSSIDFGRIIVDYYNKYYTETFKAKGVTLSLLDLSKVQDIENKINSLFEDVDSNLTIDYSNVSRTRNQAKSFGRVSANSLYDLVDLYDLIDKLPSSYSDKARQVKEALNLFVVYQKTDLANTNGVSIYFPFENKNNIANVISLYSQFGFASEYTKFITNFSSRLTGNKMSNWRLSGNVPSINNDTISVTVPDDVSKNYSSASYVIFEKINDKYYMPRFKGSDVSVSNNVFSTTIEKKGIVAYDDDESVYLTAFESEKGKDYVKYLIPSIIQKWGSRMSENFTNEAIYVEFVVDESHPTGVITGAIPIISGDKEEDLVAPKLSFELKDWKLIQFWNTSYKIFDDNGNYTTDWESSGSMSGIEFMIEDGFELEFRNLDSSKEYYALFHIYDSQGNRYTTNMVRVNV